MTGDRHWLIVYDIRDKKRLVMVERLVSSYGWQLQKSVYESCVNQDAIFFLKTKLEKIVEPDDFIIIFSVCEKDWQKRVCWGIQKKLDIVLQGDYVIL